MKLEEIKKLLIVLSMVSIFVLTGCSKKEEVDEIQQFVEENSKYSIDNIDEKFTSCEAFNIDEVTYITNGSFVLNDKEIYKIGTYSDGTTCRKFDIDIEKTQISEGLIFFYDTEGNSYFISGGKLVDLSYIYSDYIINYFKNNDIVEINGRTLGKTSGEYVSKKNDGNYYLATINYSSHDVVEEPYEFDYETNGVDESEQILDFSGAINTNEFSTILTDKNLYTYETTNKKECKKYDDVKCIKEHLVNEFYSKFKDKISYVDYSRTSLIYFYLDDGRVVKYAATN